MDSGSYYATIHIYTKQMELNKQQIPFTQVANNALNNSDLSAKAKGIYAYLLSKPNGWDFSIDRIVLDFKDEYDSISTGIKELETLGYLERKKQQDGRVRYNLFNEVSQTGKIPDREIPNQGNSQPGKIHSISNKEIYNKKEVNSKKELDACGVEEIEIVPLNDEDLPIKKKKPSPLSREHKERMALIGFFKRESERTHHYCPVIQVPTALKRLKELYRFSNYEEIHGLIDWYLNVSDLYEKLGSDFLKCSCVSSYNSYKDHERKKGI